jgi:broad specificity phosphatase PhoE
MGDFAQAVHYGKRSLGPLSRRLPFLAKNAQRLWLCRHGETAGNAHGLVQGSGLDLPLNEKGQQQAQKLGQALASFQFDVVASSDLCRAVETAAAVAAFQPPTYYGMMDPALREMHFGELEGMPIATVKGSGQMSRVQDRWAEGELDVSWPGIGGESASGVARRGQRGLLALLDGADEELGGKRPKNVLVVAHGRFNKLVISSLLRGNAGSWGEIEQDNTCVNILERTVPDADGTHNDGVWHARVLNDTGHLPQRLVNTSAASSDRSSLYTSASHNPDGS